MALCPATTKDKYGCGLLSHCTYMQTIVVVGAGFGGLRSAIGLSKRLPNPKKIRIILVDKNSYHTYTPSLYEVATAYRERHMRADGATEQDFEEQLGGSACFSVREIVAQRNITFVRGEVTSINARLNTVALRGGNDIHFDYCIVALGSVAAYHVDGAQTCCNTLKTLTDALRIRERIEELFDKANRDGQCVHLATVGAGLSGFEIACEMAYYAGHLARAYNIDRTEIELTLIEAGPSILPRVPPSMRRAGVKRLEELGITVMTGDHIVKAEPGALHFSSGERLHTDFVLWSGGIKGHPMLKNAEGLTLDNKGRVIVDRFLHAHGADHIYAIGDNVAYHDEKRAIEAPATAWAAQQQADATARNIIARLRGREEKPFSLSFPGYVSAAGGKYGIAHLYGITIVGFPAWALKRIIDLKYILSLYPPWKGLMIWVREVRIFSRND